MLHSGRPLVVLCANVRGYKRGCENLVHAASKLDSAKLFLQSNDMDSDCCEKNESIARCAKLNYYYSMVLYSYPCANLSIPLFEPQTHRSRIHKTQRISAPIAPTPRYQPKTTAMHPSQTLVPVSKPRCRGRNRPDHPPSTPPLNKVNPKHKTPERPPSKIP